MSQPRRHPVIPKYFEKEDTIMASGSASRAVRAGEPSGAGSVEASRCARISSASVQKLQVVSTA